MQSTSNETKSKFDPKWLEHGYGSRTQGFQNLMRYRIRNILLVSSLYDLFLFEEDGRLYELLREEYQALNLSHAPELIRVSSGKEAIKLAKNDKWFDVIITTLHIDDMPAHKLAAKVRQANLDIPVVLLAYDRRELAQVAQYERESDFDQVFLWQGDFRIIIAIIKQLEDRLNIARDVREVGVQVIILVEDQVKYYSSFLPLIYKELFQQSQRLMGEGISLTHKFMRMRARPKIILCTNYEAAWKNFSKYKDYVLGIISDIDFMRKGKQDPEAGIKLARKVKSIQHDIPVLLQSNQVENEQKAYDAGASFALKNSPTLMQDVRNFMHAQFGFGDFIFRNRDKQEIGRASDLKSLEDMLRTVPEESIHYHSENNHFSNWLKARTEFWLAHKLRPRQISQFSSVQALREDLIASVRDYRRTRQFGVITDFKKGSFYPLSSFARIGGGSMGGKARGLSFINRLIHNYKINDHFKRVDIYVPPTLVLGTEVFDQFLDDNNLRSFALNAEDDREIIETFMAARRFPAETVVSLIDFLEVIRTPLAVRSSSLLEDSQYFPFAGVYNTYMIPNNNPEQSVRLQELIKTIKRVYASTFFQNSKNYFKVTSYRLEEEKMAVVIQKLVGVRHGPRFYPDFSGVAKSHNFYPVEPQKSTDGVASIALGLGKTVADGGVTVKFCPKYPNLVPQFSTIDDSLQNNQQRFHALNLKSHFEDEHTADDQLIEHLPLSVAAEDDTIKYVASTYSHQNHTIYDGISRDGHRIVTFAPVLKQKIFPLPEILELLLEMGSWAMGAPVEIEFAGNVSVPKDRPQEFAFLQMRPLVLRHELDELNIDDIPNDKLICQSQRVMGNGLIKDIFDIVVVDQDGYDRFKSREVAVEVSQFNSKLLREQRSYLLIGVGRWGSLDPLLGIPVKWDQISGAKVIIEAGFKEFDVTPSQGSHFFHNLTSFMVGYFTVGSGASPGFINWEWLRTQAPLESKTYSRLIRLSRPISVKMNGRENKGIINLPEGD